MKRQVVATQPPHADCHCYQQPHTHHLVYLHSTLYVVSYVYIYACALRTFYMYNFVKCNKTLIALHKINEIHHITESAVLLLCILYQ